MVALAVAAREFRGQRFEGGVKLALFLEGEIGALVLRYDFQAAIALNAIVGVIDPDRIAPILERERPARQVRLKFADQRFGIRLRYRAAELNGRVVHHATRIANHRTVPGFQHIVDVVS